MAVDVSQLQPDLSQSSVDFLNIGSDLPQEQTAYASPTDPSLDPSLDQSQSQDQSLSTAGLGTLPTGNPGQSSTGLGSSVFDPRSLIGKNIKDVPQYGPSGFNPHSLVGKNIKDVMGPQSQMPQPLPAQNSDGKQQFGNDWMGGVLNWEQQNLPGWMRGFVHSATEQILPTAAAIATPIVTDALIGTAFDELGPWGTIAGGLIGLGSAIAGGALASSGQQAAMKQIMPSQDLSAYEAQRQYESQNYPISEALGGLAPQMLTFRANPQGLKSAGKLIGDVFANKGKVTEILKSNPEGLQDLLFAAYGSLNTVPEAQNQIQNGNLNPATLAINLVGGVLFSKPRWIGDHLGNDPTARENAVAGRREMMSSVSDSYRQQVTEDPTNAILYRRLADLYTTYASMRPENDTSGVESQIKQYQQMLEQAQAGAPQAPIDTVENKNENPTGSGGSGNQEIRNLASQYAQGAGIPVPVEGGRVKVDPEKASRLAKFYEEAQSNPNDPEVQKAY